eukprot:6492443-Amphidinium_carterae.1
MTSCGAADPVSLWEEAITSGSQVLDGTEQILRSLWIIDLPVTTDVDAEKDGAPTSYAEVKVVGIHWPGGPGGVADLIVLAVPGNAVSEQQGQSVDAVLYHPDTTETAEVVEVKLLTLPSHYLVKRLGESCPQEAECVGFSPEGTGGLPAGSELFGVYESTPQGTTGIWACLGLVDEATGGDPDASSALRVVSGGTEGEGLDEVYVSASEGVGTGDPRQFLSIRDPADGVTAAFRGRGGAPGAKRSVGPAKAVPVPASVVPPPAGAFPKGGKGRAQAVATVLKATAPKTTVAKKPKTVAELASSMTSALETFSQRLEALEAGRVAGTGAGAAMMGQASPMMCSSSAAAGPGVTSPSMCTSSLGGLGPPMMCSSSPIAPPMCSSSPTMCSSSMGLQAPGAWQGAAGDPSSSLLAVGRVSSRQTVPPPITPAGERAYRQAIKEAKTLMPTVLPSGGPEGEGAGRPARERGVDSALRQAIEQGGETASSAVQLAMLETLERLANPQDRRGRETRGDTLEELLFGSGEEEDSTKHRCRPRSLERAFRSICVQGLGVRFDWSPLVMPSIWAREDTFCSTLGFEANVVSIVDPPCTSPQRKGPTSWSKDSAIPKGYRVATTMGGHWAVAWTLTGVVDPEPSSSVHNGLATPLEVATAIAFVKDSKVLEEASRKTGGQSHGQEGGQSWGSPANQNGGGGRGQAGGGRRGRGGGRGGVAGDAAAPQSG